MDCSTVELDARMEGLAVVVVEGGTTDGVELGMKVLENDGVFTVVAWLIDVEVCGIDAVEGKGLLFVVVVIIMLDIVVVEGNIDEGVLGATVLGDEARLVDIGVDDDDDGDGDNEDDVDDAVADDDNVLVVELSRDSVEDIVVVGIEEVVNVVLGSEVVVSPLPTPSVNDPTGVSEMSDRDVEVVADGFTYVWGVTIEETNGVVLLLEDWLFGLSVT